MYHTWNHKAWKWIYFARQFIHASRSVSMDVLFGAVQFGLVCFIGEARESYKWWFVWCWRVRVQSECYVRKSMARYTLECCVLLLVHNILVCVHDIFTFAAYSSQLLICWVWTDDDIDHRGVENFFRCCNSFSLRSISLWFLIDCGRNDCSLANISPLLLLLLLLLLSLFMWLVLVLLLLLPMPFLLLLWSLVANRFGCFDCIASVGFLHRLTIFAMVSTKSFCVKYIHHIYQVLIKNPNHRSKERYK